MTQCNDRKSTCWTKLAAFLLAIVAIGQPISAQTPSLTNLTLSSTSGANSLDDAIQCTYSLVDASTAGVAWYRNGQPMMTLYMPSEGGASTALQDFSGSGMTPISIGTSVWSATAGRGSTGAFQFDGTNYINAGNAFPTASSYSALVWAYPTDMRFTGMPIGSSASGSPGHALRISRDGRLTAGHNGNWRILQTGPGEITLNNWYLLAVTYDVATGALTLYKNGQPVDATILTPAQALVTDATVQIGALQGTSMFRGVLDDVRIYNTVLSPEQIAVLYGGDGPNLISPQENNVGDIWQTRVTPFSSLEAGTPVLSNELTIVATSPLITSLPITSGIAGKNYSYDVEATGGPKPSFELLSGPTGMTIDETTGLVTWTPTGEGVYPISVSASNSEGTDIQGFDLAVAAPTVGVADVQLTASPEGDLLQSHSLALSATTSAAAWTRDGEPLMSLFMPGEGGPEYGLEDYSGHEWATTPVGNPAWIPNGDRNGNGAWEFEGENYIDAGDIFPTYSSYTKAVWIYHTVGGEFHHILSGWDHNITGTEGHGMRVSYDNRLSAGQNGNWRIVQSDSYAISLNRWYLAAVTFDYATSEMILYIDGVPVDTAVLSDSQRDVSDARVLVGATQGAFAWKGMLDDIRLYDYPLTSEQIQNLYDNGGSRILASDTEDGQIWQSHVTGFSATEASVPFASNPMMIGVINQPPALASIGPRAVQETQLLTFSVTATDPDATTPGLSADPLPANATFFDAGDGTGSFSFSPSYSQAGTFDIWFVASDGQAADSELVTITVTDMNRAPVLAAIGSQTIAEGSILNLPLSASDPDGDAVVLLTGTLPANANFADGGDGNGTFTFAPSYLQAGVIDVWFSVLDESMASDSELVQITVTDTPQNALWLANFSLQGETAGSAVTDADVQIGVQMSSQLSWTSPAPPEYTALLGLRDVDNGGPYFRDVRRFGDECYYWVLEIDPHGNVSPPATPRCATLNWNPAEFSPDHVYVLREGLDPDGAILVANMRTATQYEVCDIQTPRYVTVHWESSACAEQAWATLSLTSGWNLISLPVTPVSMSLVDIIPSAEIAFDYNGGYREVTEFETCSGYWIRVPSDTTILLAGTPVTGCTESLTEGWYLVGAPNCVATPESTPVDALQAFFGFDGAYSPQSETTPGSGYWVNVNADCSFDLACAAPAPASAPLASGTEATGSRLIITAERQVERDISTAVVMLGAGGVSAQLESPPEAPEYSVKMNLYGSDWTGPYYSDIRSSSMADNAWILAVNPVGNEGGSDFRTVVLSWDPTLLGQDKYSLYEGTDANGPMVVADMSTIENFTVTGDSRDQYFTIMRSSAKNNILPSEYALSQNYPNPFNPITQISFAMAQNGHARLEVLNILGQHVRTVLDKTLTAGEHNVTWDATNDSGQSVATGVYLYRLVTDNFSSTRKMVLLK